MRFAPASLVRFASPGENGRCLANFFLPQPQASSARMDKFCETCKQRVEHDYWDILDDQGKCFFKVIMDDLHEMTIPKKFAERFKGNISRMIKLEARNGSVCEVAVKRCADKLILQSGWVEFVNKHDLKMGDFTVFRYKGDSQFKVGIFDPTGCEKAPSCVNMNNPRPTRTVKSYSEHHSSQSLDNSVEMLSSSTPSGKPGDASSSQDDVSVQNVPPYMIASNIHLTPLQEDKVEGIVQAINSDIPILVTIMSKSYVKGTKCRLAILRKYAVKYLPQEKKRVVLQHKGKRSEMWLHIATRGDRRLVRGWSQFVQDNNLRLGDICLFERLDDRKVCRMNVHIIRDMKCDKK